jgi:glyoxylase-like metal-dependent hydrolase (beta-lactamase superfamily II)
MPKIEDLKPSKHFELEALAPGVYAAICGDRGAGVGNAGFVDLGDRVLAFDTFLTPQAATDMKALAAALTGRQPELVINSHYHNDHIWGNQVFLPKALILASEGARELIKTEGQEEYDYYGAQSAGRYAELCEQYEQSDDATERENLIPWLDYYRGLAEAFPDLKMCPPQITVPDRLTIYGSRRRADLLTYKNGHTGSDSILYLPQDQILFAADLLFVQCHPFFVEADPFKLIAILEGIEEMDFTKIVPGHGPVGTKEDVSTLIDYVRGCIATAECMIAEGDVDEEAIAALEIPSPYESWKIPHFYQMNMRHLLEFLAEG